MNNEKVDNANMLMTMRGSENLEIIASFFKFYNIRQLTVYRQFSRKTKPFQTFVG